MSGAPPGRSFRVVMIEDYEDLRSLLQRFLQRSGAFEVVGSYATGAEGMAAVRRLVPDLILLDISLPDMSGLDAIDTLREAAPDARIVILTGAGSESGRERALAAGADAYIEKVKGGDELPELLLGILNSQRPS
jgi:DNA-binding NarL/FixJ family response regulator